MADPNASGGSQLPARGQGFVPAAPQGLVLLQTIRGHIRPITTVTWTSDGRRLLTASGDWTVRMCDPIDGQLILSLEGHVGGVYSIVAAPNGRTLISCSEDTTVRVWSADSGEQIYSLRTHQDKVYSVAVTPDSRRAVSASADKNLVVWNLDAGRALRILKGHTGLVYDVAVAADGRRVVSASADKTLIVWDLETGGALRQIRGHSHHVLAVALTPDGRRAASASADKTVRIWDLESGRCLRVFEGHTSVVYGVALTSDGRWMASTSTDGTVRLHEVDGSRLSVLSTGREHTSHASGRPAAFHPNPKAPVLATVCGPQGDIAQIWHLDLGAMVEAPSQERSTRYRNARVILVGDSGVGKSGLGLVLSGQKFRATESTEGRHVWAMETRQEVLREGLQETRETLLWDLAGQPGYRLVHQLHLREIAVAIVVFDARSETDPLAGVRHWDRAIQQASQRQADSLPPPKKYLVVARTDRGGVSVSKQRIEMLVREMAFDGYFETSAKEGWQIPQLREAVFKAIEWELLPQVVSTTLFDAIKRFLLEQQKAGRVLSTGDELFHTFEHASGPMLAADGKLREKFYTCIRLLENRDLVRRLTFGNQILLQPELLDAYASAIVNAAKAEPDGLGSMHEEVAQRGTFPMNKDARVADRGVERVLLLAAIEELLVHDLALREYAEEGPYLVFPSQFNRDWEEAPDPQGKELTVAFEGPVQSVYTTLAVRLAHSGRFETARTQMWRNAAIYTAVGGGRCGIYLREFVEARGELTVFFRADEAHRPASEETRFQFIEYALAHVRRKALMGSVRTTRAFVCRQCGTAVPTVYADGALKRNLDRIECGVCGEQIMLRREDGHADARFSSEVLQIDEAADRWREHEGFITTVDGEVRSRSIAEWAGGGLATLAVVFTDMVESTSMTVELGGERMSELRQAHFSRTRELLKAHGGREVKTLGDGFLTVFRSAVEALDFALDLHENPGHARLSIRAGIHVGPIQIDEKEGDTFGAAVNFAARVTGTIAGAEIWVSDQARDHIDQHKAAGHRDLTWEARRECKLKGFPHMHTLWRVLRRDAHEG